jgi:hypothetical protein
MVLGSLALVMTACGSPTAHAGVDTTNAATTTTAGATPVGGFVTPEVKYGTGQVGAPDPTTSVPTDRGTDPINPAQDAGQAVIIAKGGYLLPEWLIAEETLPITWTNLSGVPQQVIFDTAPVHSQIIPAGGTFTWMSPHFAINLTYHTAHGHHAQLTLQNPNATN